MWNSTVIDWLLEENNPSVRYFALTHLLGNPETDCDVMQSKENIMKTGLVPEILKNQHDDGTWEAPHRFYTAKYKGTVWQLIILAELGADGKNWRIKNACEFILKNSQHPESGGFCSRSTPRGGNPERVSPCLTGNMVFSLIRLGYYNDVRVQKGIDWITTYQRFDDGIEKSPEGWPYHDHVCWGRHTCHMGVVKALKALSEIPLDKRTRKVDQTIQKGAEYLLIHHLYKRSHDLRRIAKPQWLRLGFPWMYNTDVLEMLGLLTRPGYKDHRLQEAVDVLASKQDSEGKWLLQNTYNGKYQVDIEQKGKQSKWITLHALKVLKRFYS